jgi:sirohydrochlorin ferrochelatase
LLLTGGYHLRVDLPSRVDDVLVTSPVGRDPRLAAILAERLVAAKAPAGAAVTLAAAGSVDPAALADVRAAAAALAARLQVGVEVGYLSAGDPELTRDWRQDRVGPGQPWVLAPYLLAPGRFYDRAVALGADVVAEPIGAHPLLAAVVLERYDGVAGVDRGVTQDAGQVPGRTAPA